MLVTGRKVIIKLGSYECTKCVSSRNILRIFSEVKAIKSTNFLLKMSEKGIKSGVFWSFLGLKWAVSGRKTV